MIKDGTMRWNLYSKSAIMLSIVLSGVWMPCFALQTEGLRGKRFCEVIISKGKLFEIYNTIYLNDCPQENWSKLNADYIKKEANSSYVVLNGPRQFTMDGAKDTLFIDDTLQIFQGLAMRKSGVLDLSMRETFYGSLPFHEHHVKQKTTWVYAPGKKIYEIIDPEGHVYVMHSFTLSSAIRSERDLVNLEQYLKLPKGWKFKTGILTKVDELVTIQKKAIVIQDNMKNTYQLAGHDFLN